MVVKSFTLLNYFTNGKEKQEEKENFTAAPPPELFCDRVLYLSLFLLGSARRREARKTGFRVCATSPSPSSPVQMTSSNLLLAPFPNSPASVPGNQ